MGDILSLGTFSHVRSFPSIWLPSLPLLPLPFSRKYSRSICLPFASLGRETRLNNFPKVTKWFTCRAGLTSSSFGFQVGHVSCYHSVWHTRKLHCLHMSETCSPYAAVSPLIFILHGWYAKGCGFTIQSITWCFPDALDGSFSLQFLQKGLRPLYFKMSLYESIFKGSRCFLELHFRFMN